jgi:FlaA1/EpsC-like NDP-sugar epimerase
LRLEVVNPKGSYWREKSVLVTGVCGTVGSELLRQLVALGAGEVTGLDNNESEVFFLGQAYQDNPRVRLYLCDIRDVTSLGTHMGGVDVVIHAAAYKHVILCEQSPTQAVQTNILGTQAVIESAMAAGVERVIFTSSDKAVNPTNVMGTSKLMGERLMTAANSNRRAGDAPIFASTRFGNVLGSRGSVIPLFSRQIAAGGPVTLTDPSMSRFIMTIEESVSLVLNAVPLALGGEVFVTKMPVIKIIDLAEVMIRLLSSPEGRPEVRVVGAKPGEKLYEELMTSEESRRTIELDDYFVVTPAFRSVYRNISYDYPGSRSNVGVEEPYNSAVASPLKGLDLENFLLDNGLLPNAVEVA